MPMLDLSKSKETFVTVEGDVAQIRDNTFPIWICSFELLLQFSLRCLPRHVLRCAAAEAEAEAEESEARTSAPGDTPAKNAQRRDESSSEISRAHVVPPAPNPSKGILYSMDRFGCPKFLLML